ncbi:MAG TPA: aldo/keto reductase [Gammaproteobacteria bacterium]|nr:aldo/keto reductase [Gammaproteobacteria bacterium]
MIEKFFLANSDLQISRVGLGTVKFGRNQGIKYPAPFSLPTDREVQELLYCAQELGINLLDTAPAYGISEERLGKLWIGAREDWVLCTKAGEDFVNGESYFDFSAKAIRESVLRSLKRLKTDYLDIVLIHSNGEDVKLIEDDNVFETLRELKKSGLIRAFGMSTKTIDGGKLAVDHSDVVMVTFNPLQAEERSVIQYAEKKNKTILIKKALASGHVEKISGNDPVQAAMNFIFAEKGVGSVILGTLNKEHLKHNMQCVRDAVFRVQS